MTANEDAGKIGRRLRALRLKRFPTETAQDFARRCRVHPTLLSRIERGRIKPTLPTVEKLADGLGVTVGQVFEGDAEGVPDSKKET